MGAFQAVASGLGETGEQIGTGLNNALNEALKVQLQQHNMGMDQSNLAFRYAQLKQENDLATQQHELMRQQMLNSGWTHTGTVRGTDGQYYQQFDNPRMPLGQQTSKIPYAGGGVPPDSFEAHMANRQNLIDQGYDSDKATEVAFKMANLYRTDPAGLVKEYQGIAKDMNENQGIGQVPVFGFGKIDISTPEGQAKYAQAMIDSGRGMGPLLRSMMGFGPGAGSRDMTGWTANEMREYKPLEDEAKRKEDILVKLATARINNTFDPEQQKAIQNDLTGQLDPLWKGVNDKYAEISNRHHGPIAWQPPPNAPDPSKQPDGALLKDTNGRTVAIARGGKWQNPSIQ